MHPPHQVGPTGTTPVTTIISERAATLFACIRVLSRPLWRVFGAQFPVFRRIGIITVVTYPLSVTKQLTQQVCLTAAVWQFRLCLSLQSVFWGIENG